MHLPFTTASSQTPMWNTPCLPMIPVTYWHAQSCISGHKEEAQLVLRTHNHSPNQGPLNVTLR